MPMVRGLSESPNRVHVHLGAVALVTRPVVVVEMATQFNHDAVPVDFGEYRRGRDRRTALIALDEGRGGHRVIREHGWWFNVEADVLGRAQQIEGTVNQRHARTDSKRVERSCRGDR